MILSASNKAKPMGARGGGALLLLPLLLNLLLVVVTVVKADGGGGTWDPEPIHKSAPDKPKAAPVITPIYSGPSIELEIWTQPIDDWTTSDPAGNGGDVIDGRNVALFDALQQVHWVLGPTVVKYDINQVVQSGSPKCIFVKPDNCIKNCVCKNHRYCARPPSDTKHSHTSGKELLGETIRRICAWKFIQEQETYDPSKFLDYMFHFKEAKCDQHNYGRTCLKQVYTLSEMEEDSIVNCAKAAGGFNAEDNALLNASLTKAQMQPFYPQMAAEANDAKSKLFPLLRIQNQTLPTEAFATPQDLLKTICDALPTNKKPTGCQGDTEVAIQSGIDSHTTAPDPNQLIAEANDLFQDDISQAAATTATSTTSTTTTTDLDSKIIVDIWTTPLYDWNTDDKGNGPNKLLYQRFQKIQYDFINYPNLILRPRNFVYKKSQVCNQTSHDERKECADSSCTNRYKYCALGPDDWIITGKTMVEETLRRACIWELMPKREYFDYWVWFHKNECDNEDFHQDCITQALQSVNIPVEKVDACMNNTGGLVEGNNTILQDLIAIQDVTFPTQELNYKELPIVTVDGKQATSLKTLSLYQKICEAMKEHHDNAVAIAAAAAAKDGDDDKTPTPPPVHPICKKNDQELQDYINTFDVDLKKIYQREKKFEEYIATKTNTKPPGTSSETLQTNKPLVEVWTTPILDWEKENGETDATGDGPNIELFQKMKELVIGFGTNIVFRPQYYLYNKEEVCGPVDPRTFQPRPTLANDPEERKKCQDRECTNTARYCAFGPTKNKDIHGSNLLAETLRRTCLWHLYGRNTHQDDTVKFFDYLTEYHTTECHKKTDCLMDIYNNHGINHYNLGHCQTGSGDTRTSGRENTIFEDMMAVQNAKFYYYQLDMESLPIVMINGVPLEEGGTNLSLDELFQKVCDEFPGDEDDLPDICQGQLDENLGEDTMNNTAVPSSLVEELEGDAIGEDEIMDILFNFTTEAPTTGEDDGDDEGTAATTTTTTIVPTTDSPTTEAPDESTVPPTTETPLETTDSPTGASTTFSPTAAAVTTSSPTAAVTTTSTTSSPTAGVETSSPTGAATLSPTGGPKETESTAEPAATKTTVPPAAAAQTQTPVDITAETSSPQGVWGVNGADATPPAVAQRTSGDITKSKTPQATRPADSQMATTEATLDMEAKPLSEVDTLEELDMTLVTSAIDHIEALQKCDVDTKMLIKKLMALAADGQTMTKEISSIETDLPLFMSENCPHKEGEEIMDRMRSFQKCSMYNLQELIETFPSAAMGVAMRCTHAYSKMTPQEEKAGFVPEACIRTIEAQGILGRALFGLYLYPDVSCPCFEKLGKNIPECTADVWPIPINGVLVKTQSCLVGQYCLAIDGLCEKNLEILNKCLPSEDVRARDVPCGKVFDACSELYDNVPPLLNAAPLPDACVRIAEGSEFYGSNLVKRYDTFRRECGQNLELWDGHTPVAEFKAFVEDGINGINFYGFDFLSGISGGFLLGIAFCIIFVIVRNICRFICNCMNRICKCCGCGNKKKNARPRTKDYATVDTNGEEVPEYRD